MRVVAFTDGSCYWKIRKGGWGAYIEFPSSEVEIKGGCFNTTISRMEIRAVLEVLKLIPYTECHLILYSDSEYVVKAFAEDRLLSWVEKGFAYTKNDDLWKKILHEIIARDNLIFDIIHVRGHQKLDNDLAIGNAIADELADYKNHKFYEKDLDY